MRGSLTTDRRDELPPATPNVARSRHNTNGNHSIRSILCTIVLRNCVEWTYQRLVWVARKRSQFDF
eukprot:scaffold159160_cov58-Attheya_sp.AAC.5